MKMVIHQTDVDIRKLRVRTDVGLDQGCYEGHRWGGLGNRVLGAFWFRRQASAATLEVVCAYDCGKKKKT